MDWDIVGDGGDGGDVLGGWWWSVFGALKGWEKWDSQVREILLTSNLGGK